MDAVTDEQMDTSAFIKAVVVDFQPVKTDSLHFTRHNRMTVSVYNS